MPESLQSRSDRPDSHRAGTLRIAGLAALAMLAFAGNSLLNRAALAGKRIEPADFTAIRLLSGALLLLVILMVRAERPLLPPLHLPGHGRLKLLGSAAALFVYAAAFSFAYVALDAGTGALILFACVQLTMQGVAISRGQLPGKVQAGGLLLAMAGLVWLLGPAVRPPPWGSALAMACAGAAWGVYTLIGRASPAPVRATAHAFLLAAPFALLLALATPWLVGLSGLAHTMPTPTPTPTGVALAAISGMVTSALGYVLWYAALPGLSVTAAGAWQLLVPSLAALGGVLLLGEVLPMRLIGATALILLGIALTLVPRRSNGCPIA